ncbi:hypothetical protein ACFU6K_00130 [Kitasatospora sp. NPDC057512]|uniref:hypothetical protein n=1 Tax=Kitasatospora sp. NPDC057512 TaxID=3346154 RepID=UPI0036B92543
MTSSPDDLTAVPEPAPTEPARRLADLMATTSPEARARQRSSDTLPVLAPLRPLERLSPMVAPYRSPEDFVAAITLMPKEHHLDHPDFVKAYKRAAAAYRDQLVAQRQKKAKVEARQVGDLRLLPAVD